MKATIRISRWGTDVGHYHRRPVLIYSRYCHQIDLNGYILDVKIYRLEGRSMWQLEVENEEGTSVSWKTQFPTEYEAYDAFTDKVEREGMTPFLIN